MTARETLLAQVERHEDEISGVLDRVECLRHDVDQTHVAVHRLSETVMEMRQAIRRLQHGRSQ